MAAPECWEWRTALSAEEKAYWQARPGHPGGAPEPGVFSVYLTPLDLLLRRPCHGRGAPPGGRLRVYYDSEPNAPPNDYGTGCPHTPQLLLAIVLFSYGGSASAAQELWRRGGTCLDVARGLSQSLQPGWTRVGGLLNLFGASSLRTKNTASLARLTFTKLECIRFHRSAVLRAFTRPLWPTAMFRRFTLYRLAGEVPARGPAQRIGQFIEGDVTYENWCRLGLSHNRFIAALFFYRVCWRLPSAQLRDAGGVVWLKCKHSDFTDCPGLDVDSRRVTLESCTNLRELRVQGDDVTLELRHNLQFQHLTVVSSTAAIRLAGPGATTRADLALRQAEVSLEEDVAGTLHFNLLGSVQELALQGPRLAGVQKVEHLVVTGEGAGLTEIRFERLEIRRLDVLLQQKAGQKPTRLLFRQCHVGNTTLNHSLRYQVLELRECERVPPRQEAGGCPAPYASYIQTTSSRLARQGLLIKESKLV